MAVTLHVVADDDRALARNESLGYVYLPWKLGLRGPVPAISPSGA